METSDARKHIAVLERRAAFLVKRTDEAARKGKTLTHDEDELAALNWAIDELNERYE